MHKTHHILWTKDVRRNKHNRIYMKTMTRGIAMTEGNDIVVTVARWIMCALVKRTQKGLETQILNELNLFLLLLYRYS